MTAPLVALTATTKETDGMMRVRLNEAYVNAVRAAGLTPVIVPPLPPEAVEPILSAVRGVVLTGGEDVDPAEYGQQSQGSNPPHRDRDKCEIAMVHGARERNIPVLAICRGIQLVNVALGGTLIQDIPTQRPSAIDHDSKAREMRVHDIVLEPESKLSAAIGTSRAAVNSAHHQAIDRLAEGLKMTAWSPDGIVEGAEWEGHYWWMLAVQWHPEELIRDTHNWDRGLFRAFARQVHAFNSPVLFQE